MVTMAGDTIIFNQLLMKAHAFSLFSDGYSMGSFYADLCCFMAGNTLPGAAAKERGMAGKAVCGKFSMGTNRFAWSYHQLWVEYS